MYFAPPNFKTWLRAWIRCSTTCWDESQWGFSFYSVENELLLRIICHTERLKPFQITTGGQKYFRSDWVFFLKRQDSQGYRHSVEHNVNSLW